MSAIEPDSGYEVVVAPNSIDPFSSGSPSNECYHLISFSIPPPMQTSIVSDDDDDIGFVEIKSAPRCQDERIVVSRSDGHRSIIAPPKLDRPWKTVIPEVAEIHIIDGPLVFATLYLHLEISRQTVEQVFSWHGSDWLRHHVDFPSHYDGPTNMSVGAVDTSQRFAVNADFMDAMRFDYGKHDADRTYHMTETGIVDRGRLSHLGFGTTTAMRRNLAVGYIAEYSWGVNCRPPTAIRWIEARRNELGKGVAQGVDWNGDVVGDDRAPAEATSGGCDWSGHPMLWHGSSAVKLSVDDGSALAIRNGTIVGELDGRGFIIFGNDAQRMIHYLDDLVTGNWSITSAFWIGPSGRILAIGSKPGSSRVNVLVLKPIGGLIRIN